MYTVCNLSVIYAFEASLLFVMASHTLGLTRLYTFQQNWSLKLVYILHETNHHS